MKARCGGRVQEVVDGRMEVGRYAHTAAVHAGTICAVGGIDSTDTVEVYDTTTKVWSEIGDGGMSQRLYGSASAVHNGKLYVIGGRTGMYMSEALRSVEVYDFATQ